MPDRNPRYAAREQLQCNPGYVRLPPPPHHPACYEEIILPRMHTLPDLAHFQDAHDALHPGLTRQLTRRRWLDCLEGPEFPAPPPSIIGHCRQALSEMEPWQQAEAIASLYKRIRQQSPEYPLLGGEWLVKSLALSPTESTHRTREIAHSLLDTGFLSDTEASNTVRAMGSQLLGQPTERINPAMIAGVCTTAAASALYLAPIGALTLTGTMIGLATLHHIRRGRIRAIVNGYLREVEHAHTMMRSGTTSSLDEMLGSLSQETKEQRTATEAFLLTRTLRVFGISSLAIHTALARSSSVTSYDAPIVRLLHKTLTREGLTPPETLYAAFQRAHHLRPLIERLHNSLGAWTTLHRDTFRSRFCEIVLDLRYGSRHSNTPRPRLAWVDGNLTWLQPQD
jgi:hypothetical protein